MAVARNVPDWQIRLNGLVRHAMVRGAPGFGPPKVVLTEYPKSGGTWVGQMLAEYLAIPNPRNRVPPRRRCLVHGHYLRVARSNDTVLVWRDGRDAMVSYYYYALIDDPTLRRGWVDGHRRRLGIRDDRDVLDVQRHLPGFIEYCFTDGPPRGMTWASFAAAWKGRAGKGGAGKCRARVAETSYEAMIADPRREMAKLLRALSVAGIDDARLDACIAKYSFEAVTGRRRGEEDPASFVRKGIGDDWKNKFTREARQVFDRHAGHTLIDLGYEPDRSWVDG